MPAGSLQFRADVTYQVNIGGSFTVGTGSATKAFSNPSKTSSGEVATYFESSSSAKYNGVKELLNWTSSNNQILRMQNLPYLGGVGTPLQSGSVTITATTLAAGGQPVSGSFTYQSQPTAARTLVSLQVSPRNQVYGLNQIQPANGSYPYYCTGFYSDGSVASLTGLVSWSVNPSPNQANAQFVQTSSGTSLSMNQPGQSTPTPYNLTLNASYQGVTDQTTIQIVPPVSQPNP